MRCQKKLLAEWQFIILLCTTGISYWWSWCVSKFLGVTCPICETTDTLFGTSGDVCPSVLNEMDSSWHSPMVHHHLWLISQVHFKTESTHFDLTFYVTSHIILKVRNIGTFYISNITWLYLALIGSCYHDRTFKFAKKSCYEPQWTVQYWAAITGNLSKRWMVFVKQDILKTVQTLNSSLQGYVQQNSMEIFNRRHRLKFKKKKEF